MDLDPWNWSVQEVQSFFRNQGAAYISDMPHSHLPPLEPFLSKLRDNDVSGAVLLTAIDAPTLRDDCGVSTVAFRSAVMHCIRKLQRRSAVCNTLPDPQRIQTPASLPFQALLPASEPQETILPTTETVGENVRSGEIQVQDTHGRKRRKLDLSNVAPVLNESDELLSAFIQSEASNGYLGDKACLVDELFYGQTASGRIIGELECIGNVLVLQADNDAGSSDTNFQFTNQHKPIGESHYVYTKMRHLFQNEEETTLQRQGREAVAFLPYREKDTLKARSATVLQFRPNDDEPIAMREDAAYLLGGHSPETQNQQDMGEWDFLIQKHKTQDNNLLPVYGESDAGDGGESVDQTATSEAEPEAIEEDDEMSGLLTLEQKSDIAEQFIKDCIDRWHEALPQLEQKSAWTIWKKMKQSRSIREVLIQGAQGSIEHLTRRLNKMKDDFLAGIWEREDKLREACSVLEPTIEDRELQRWKITVWQRRQEPAHIVRHSKQKKKDALKAGTTENDDFKLHIHPEDRFSVSPAPVIEDHGGQQDEIYYDADDEVNGSRRQSFDAPLDDGFVVQTPEEDGVELATQMVGDREDEDMLDYVLDNADGGGAKSKQDETDVAEDGISESESLPNVTTLVPCIPKTPTRPSILPIDLTISSSDTPPSTRRRRPTKPTKPSTAMTNNPIDATASEIESWNYSTLVMNNDRMRILMKLLFEVDAKLRARLRQTFYSLQRPAFASQLQAAVRSLRAGTADAHLGKDVAETMMELADIYLRWSMPSATDEQIQSLTPSQWNDVLNLDQFSLFTSMLAPIVSRKDFSQKPKASSSKPGSSTAPIDLSSGLDMGSKADSKSQKKRKKLVNRSATAQDSRTSALNRQKRHQEASQTADSAQLVAMIQSDPSHSNIEINPAKDEDDDFIYISERISRKMKAHQIDGTRFLWREITADGQPEGQGCILAHTMGLGKTMQTIAVLIALEESAHSSEPRVRKQLPPHLRKKEVRERSLRILVLCPPGLIQNWQQEITKWTIDRFWHVQSIESKSKASHSQRLKEWMKFGGVLLIGYPMLRALLAGKSKKTDPQAIKSEEVITLEKYLLAGPDIVVADEAHNLKNNGNIITSITSRFKTESRIALTGTPMSNDVDEIYALVSWVAPGFLGDGREFRAHFTEPIKEGLYASSTPYERRKSLMKLKVLQAEIEPKVNRANIEVLRGSLKPKIEYFITLPLRSIQAELYKRYIKTLLGDRSESAANVKIFAWLNVLTLLTNHPHCFRQKLLEPPTTKKKQRHAEEAIPGDRTPSTASESRGESPQLDETAASADESKDETDRGDVTNIEDEDPNLNSSEIAEILKGLEDNLDPTLSAKITVLLKLLDYSIECKDKALIFSSSIPTMNYLSDLFQKENRRFGRIDGDVPTFERMRLLEQFDRDAFDTLLVSTRAGGVGLNIQGANRVFILDFKFDPALEEQAIGRAYRLGQQKPVYVYRFITGGTFEKNLYDQQLFKSSLTQRVVDKKNPRRNVERHARDYLYEPKRVVQEDITKSAGHDTLVLDRLLEQHHLDQDGNSLTQIRAIRTMEILQEDAMDAPLDAAEQKEVNDEIEQNRKRPRGKRAAAMEATAAPAPPGTPATAPQPKRSAGLLSLSVPPTFMQRLSSTQAPAPGPSAVPHAHPTAGLSRSQPANSRSS